MSWLLLDHMESEVCKVDTIVVSVRYKVFHFLSTKEMFL